MVTMICTNNHGRLLGFEIDQIIGRVGFCLGEAEVVVRPADYDFSVLFNFPLHLEPQYGGMMAELRAYVISR